MWKLMGACGALAAACGMACGQPAYDLVIIPAGSIFGIPEARLLDINDQGEAVGTMTHTYQVGGNFHTTYFGFRWTPGAGPEVLFQGGIGAINNLGDIATGGLVRYAGGQSLSMSPLPGDQSISAEAISDSRIVVGTSTNRFYSGCRYDRQAMVWTEQTGVRSIAGLGVPSADVANDVNVHGQIVGARSFTGSCGDFEAYLFDLDTGVHTDLHGLLSGLGISEARALNDSGVVVGTGYNGSYSAAWTWEASAGFEFLPALGAGDRDRVIPTDINEAGVVVGSAPINGWMDRRAFIWSPQAGMRDLTTLVDPTPGFFPDRALAINNNGWIVGDGHYGTSSGIAYIAYVAIPRGAVCGPDLTTGAVAGQPGYGVPDGVLNNEDFFYYLAQFAAGNLAVADLTTGAVAGQPGYGVPNGVLNNEDFFYYLALYAAGC